jgi:hypothetical protein
MFDAKFPCGTQLIFGSLTFATREDRGMMLLPPGPTLEHLTLASLSALGGSCSGLGPCACSYIRTVKIVRDISVVTSILRPLAGASNSSSSASTLIQIHLTTTLRLGPALAGNPRKAVALSAWWPRMVISRTTAPTDIPPPGD